MKRKFFNPKKCANKFHAKLTEGERERVNESQMGNQKEKFVINLCVHISYVYACSTPSTMHDK